MDLTGPPRWRGQPGRLEVWYATFTDADGHGYWVHVELLAPVHGPPRLHGWAAWFPTSGAPVVERFGPVEPERGQSWAEGAGVRVEPGRLVGVAGSIRWDLSWSDDAPPLFTFPRWAWRLELLPGAQVVPAPTARFTGRLTIGDTVRELRDARGALAHIYGHGNALRWGWLHADLGGGDVVEVVAAASRHPLFGRLGVRPFVRLRVEGRDWPGAPLAAALRFRSEPRLPRWEVSGRWGRRRVRIVVDIPPDRVVSLGYTDPDGATATCTNSERASVRVELERWRGRWRPERRWQIDGTAHAEVGARP